MNNHLWWLEDFESKISSKKVRRRAELYGYFYARKVFGLDSIMSDKDQNHLLDELQIARAEIDRLRELLRWRDSNKESPIENADYLVQYLEFSGGGFARMVVYWDGSWPPYFPNRKSCYWRPIGPLPGGE